MGRRCGLCNDLLTSCSDCCTRTGVTIGSKSNCISRPRYCCISSKWRTLARVGLFVVRPKILLKYSTTINIDSRIIRGTRYHRGSTYRATVELYYCTVVVLYLYTIKILSRYYYIDTCTDVSSITSSPRYLFFRASYGLGLVFEAGRLSRHRSSCLCC